MNTVIISIWRLIRENNDWRRPEERNVGLHILCFPSFIAFWKYCWNHKNLSKIISQNPLTLSLSKSNTRNEKACWNPRTGSEISWETLPCPPNFSVQIWMLPVRSVDQNKRFSASYSALWWSSYRPSKHAKRFIGRVMQTQRKTRTTGKIAPRAWVEAQIDEEQQSWTTILVTQNLIFPFTN